MISNETIVVRPSQLRPGDVIADPGMTRTFEIEDIAPLMIPYWGDMVPVYWIKGTDTQSARSSQKVRTVCLPRTSWYVLARRPVTDPS